MKPTHQHIADSALKLFNQQGFASVRLQHIANAAFVSVGHLAYYFKNKQALIEFLLAQHKQASEELRQAYRIMPLFADVDRMFCAQYLLQEQYSFLYTDVLELVRAYPSLAGAYSELHQWQQVQLALMIDFQLARGALYLPHPFVSSSHIASLLQHKLFFWRHTQALRPDKDFSFEHYSTDAWQVLIPFCTRQGLQELQLEAH